MIEFKLNKGKQEERKQNNKMERKNCSETNFDKLKYLYRVDWHRFNEDKGTEEKWDRLLKIYNEGVRRAYS